MKAHVEIPLTQGLVALVDIEDYDAVRSSLWRAQRHVSRNVYALRWLSRRPKSIVQAMHTHITGWTRVDHANGDGLDNRRVNLRPATTSQNTANQRISPKNTSGFKGVSHRKRCHLRPWEAAIKSDGRTMYLGNFTAAEDAARAYDDAARKLFGEFAALNFPLPHERSAHPEGARK